MRPRREQETPLQIEREVPSGVRGCEVVLLMWGYKKGEPLDEHIGSRSICRGKLIIDISG